MSDSFQQVIQLAFDVLGADDAQRVADTLQGVGTAGDAANAKLGPLIDAFQDLANKAQLVQAAIDLQSKLQANETALDAAKASLAALNAEFDKTDKSSADINIAFAQATKSVQQLSNEQLKLQTASASTTAQLKASGVDTTNLANANDKLKTETQAAATQLTAAAGAAKQVGTAHEQAAKSADKASTAFQFVQDHLKEIISLAAAYEIAVKSFEFGKEAITDAAAVEQSLSRVKAVAQGTSDQFKELDEQIDAAAKSVNVSSQAAANGLSALVGQGLSLKGAFDALIPTLQLARIANIDVGQAAQDVAGALKAFNLPASDAQIVVDKLTVASHGAAGGLGEMAKAAIDLAPSARAIGLTFDQTVGVLETLQSQGVNVAEAVRGLRTVFDELGNSSSTLRTQLKGLGDNTSDFKNAVAALTSGTPLAKDALNSLSGSAKTLILALGNAGPDAIDKFTAALGKAAGAAKTTFQIIDDNLDGALTRFDRDLGDIGSNLAKPLLGPIKDELNALATQLETFLASDTFKKLQGQIVDFATTSFKALNDFIAHIDWDTFGKSATNAAGNVVDDLKQIATAATETAKVVNDAAHIISFAFQSASLNSKIFQGDLPGAIKSAQSLATSLLDGGSAANSAAEAQKKLGDQTKQSADSAQAATPIWDTLRDGLQQLWDKAVQAVTGLLNVGKAVSSIAPPTDPLAAVIQNLEKLGLTAEQAGDGITENGKKIINTFGAIADSSVASADQIQLAFAKALTLSSTKAEIQALQDELTKAFDAGKLSADQFSIAMQAAGRRTADIDVAAIKASASLDGVGTSGTTAAQRIVAALEDARSKLEVESEKISDDLNAAIANGADDATVSALRARLDGIRSETNQLNDELGKLPNNLSAVSSGLEQVGNAADDASGKAEKFNEAMATMGDSTASVEDKLKAAKVALDNATTSTEKQSAAAEDLHASLEAARGGATQLAEVMESTKSEFTAVSEAAGKAFDHLFDSALSGAGLVKEQVADLTNQLNNPAVSDDGGGFVNFFHAMAAAAKAVQDQIDSQRSTLADQIQRFQTFADTAVLANGKISGSFKEPLAQMLLMDEQLKNGTYDAGLLGKQELGPLQQALEAAIAKTQALNDAAAAANKTFDDLAASLQDQIDQENNDLTAIENRRHQQQLDEIEADAKAAGRSQADIQKLIDLEDQLHNKKMADIAAQVKAQQDANSQSSGGSSGGSGTSGAGGGSGGASNPRSQSPANTSPGAATQPSTTINHNYYTTVNNPFLPNTPAMTDLARNIQKELSSIASRSR